MAKKPYSEQDFVKSISSKIKQMRVDKGYTSYENFALDNKIDRKQYWRVENNANLTVKSLFKILQKLEIDPSTFFKDL